MNCLKRHRYENAGRGDIFGAARRGDSRLKPKPRGEN